MEDKINPNIIPKGDGTFSVNTPVSYEEGFTSFDDAYDFYISYGRDDKRNKIN